MRLRFVLAPLVAASWLALSPSVAASGSTAYARMTTALRAQAEPPTEQAIIDTDSAGMTFAIALRGTSLGVEFPFPGPAAHHRYRLAVDRTRMQAFAERIDDRGRVVAGPIHGRATVLYPLTAADVFRFVEAYAGTPAPDPYDARAYHITDLGRERVAGHAVEHLRLTARAGTRTAPLTDVYTDAVTSLPRRIRAGAMVPGASELRVAFAFDLGPSAHGWLVAGSRIQAQIQIVRGVTRSGHVDVRVDDAELNAPLPGRLRTSP